MFRLFKKKPAFLPIIKPLDIGVLSLGLAAFVAITASTVTKFSIWFDEAFGSYLIRFNFADLTRYTAYDVHPPLYYWLLKIWSLFFGNTELGIRSMSVFFGAVTIVGAFVLVMRLFGRRAAYVSLLFLVLSPLFIRYSQEARMYTVLTAIIVAATYLLVYAEQAKKRWPWIAYGVLLALGMLTQYFAALAWLSHWAWRALMVRQKGASFTAQFFSKDWIIAHVIAIGVFLPWLPWVIRQFADVQGNGFWIPPVTTATLPDFWTNILLFTDHNGAKSWVAAGVYAALIGVVGLAVAVTVSSAKKQRDSYLLIVCMVVVPMIVLVLLSLPPLRPAFVDRYLMSSIVFLPILIGVSIVLAGNTVRKRFLGGFAALIIVLLCIGIVNQSVTGNYNKYTTQSNNVRQLVTQVRAQHGNETIPIIANTPWIFYEAVVYERPDSPIYFVNETTTYKYGSLRMLKEHDEHKITDLDAFTREHPRFWMISNLKDSTPNKLRESWNVQKEININDDMTGTPLFRAIYVNAE